MYDSLLLKSGDCGGWFKNVLKLRDIIYEQPLGVITNLSELRESYVAEDPVEDGEDEDRDGHHEVAGVDGAARHINLKV